MTAPDWTALARIDPSRRDREAELVPYFKAAKAGLQPDWEAIDDPELLRRLGYLVDLAQSLRGQTPAERDTMARLRARLAGVPPSPFWSGSRTGGSPPDEAAAAWGLARGCDIDRLRRFLVRAPVVLPA